MRVTAISKPVVSELEMILLSAWALPFAKLSAAIGQSVIPKKQTVRDLADIVLFLF